jgi:hypothetical protein
MRGSHVALVMLVIDMMLIAAGAMATLTLVGWPEKASRCNPQARMP